MEESDVDEKRKKFHKLQEHIPFIEAQLKLIRESKNDDVVKRRSKLESLHKLLTSEFDKRYYYHRTNCRTLHFNCIFLCCPELG